jgi:hypothetical protein
LTVTFTPKSTAGSGTIDKFLEYWAAMEGCALARTQFKVENRRKGTKNEQKKGVNRIESFHRKERKRANIIGRDQDESPGPFRRERNLQRAHGSTSAAMRQ